MDTLLENIITKRKDLEYLNEFTLSDEWKTRLGATAILETVLVLWLLSQVFSGTDEFKFELQYSDIDDDLTEKLRKIINEPTFNVYKIHTSDMNAFTYLGAGASCYYTTGLVKTLNLTEGELLAILIHEYGHYKEGHTTNFAFGRKIVSMSLLYAIFSFYIVLSSEFLLKISPILAMVGLYPGLIGIFLTPGMVARAHRFTEIAADKYIAKYGYKKEGISAFQKLQEYEMKMICDALNIPRGGPCLKKLKDRLMFDEHPDTQSRIEALINALQIKALAKVGDTSKINAIFKKLLAMYKKFGG